MSDFEMSDLVKTERQKLSKTGLKPCPFCGSVRLGAITVNEELLLLIQCDECGATGPIGNPELDSDDTELRMKTLRVLWDARWREV